MNRLIFLFISLLVSQANAGEGTVPTETGPHKLFVRQKREVPPLERAEQIVVPYIAQNRGWKRNDYRINIGAISPNGRILTVTVVHKSNVTVARKGGGESLQLVVDRRAGKVTQAQRFQ